VEFYFQTLVGFPRTFFVVGLFGFLGFFVVVVVVFWGFFTETSISTGSHPAVSLSSLMLTRCVVAL